MADGQTRFSTPPGIMEPGLYRFSKDVEEYENTPFIHWGNVRVLTLVPPAAIEQEGPVEGEGWEDPPPQNEVQEPEVGIGLEKPQTWIRGAALWHVDAPESVLGGYVFHDRFSEGSTSEDHIQVRLINFTQELWLTDVHGTHEGEIGPERIELGTHTAIEVVPGDILGAVAARIGQGPTVFSPSSLRVGILRTRR